MRRTLHRTILWSSLARRCASTAPAIFTKETEGASAAASARQSAVTASTAGSAALAAGSPAGEETDATVHSPEEVVGATLRLRAALDAFSEVEQAKVDELFRRRQQTHLECMQKARLVQQTKAGHDTAYPPRESGATTVSTLDSSAMAGDAVGIEAAPPSLDDENLAAPTPSSWIRNKRAKFWAIVNPSEVTADRSVAAVKHGSTEGQMSSSTAPPPAPKTPSSTSTAAAGVVAGGAPAPDAKPTAALDVNASDGDECRPDGDRRSESRHTIDIHSIRMAMPLRPFRSPYKRNVAQALSDLLNCDQHLGPVLLAQLSAESRRLLLVMGTASEYFGGDYKEVVRQVQAADKDRDNTISANEYEAWALKSYMERHPTTPPKAVPSTAVSQEAEVTSSLSATPSAEKLKRVGITETTKSQSTTPFVMPADATGVNPITEEGAQQPPSSINPAPSSAAEALRHHFIRKSHGAAKAEDDPSSIPWATYFRLILVAATPFLAFGTLDNSILVLSGDAIDKSLSEGFGLSSMAAAGMGGIVSGVAGIQVHGLAERWTRAAPPPLTLEQQRSPWVGRSERVGNTLGMSIGLLIGMTPLLFLGKHTEEEAQEESRAEERLKAAAERHRIRKTERSELRQQESHDRTRHLSEEEQALQVLYDAMTTNAEALRNAKTSSTEA